MTNSLPWYRWLIEIDGLPVLKMVDLSMAMLNNQRVICFCKGGWDLLYITSRFVDEVTSPTSGAHAVRNQIMIHPFIDSSVHSIQKNAVHFTSISFHSFVDHKLALEAPSSAGWCPRVSPSIPDSCHSSQAKGASPSALNT